MIDQFLEVGAAEYIHGLWQLGCKLARIMPILLKKIWKMFCSKILYLKYIKKFLENFA